MQAAELLELGEALVGGRGGAAGLARPTGEAWRIEAPAPAPQLRIAAVARANRSRPCASATLRSASGNSFAVLRRKPSNPSAIRIASRSAVIGLRVAGVGAHQRMPMASSASRPT